MEVHKCHTMVLAYTLFLPVSKQIPYFSKGKPQIYTNSVEYRHGRSKIFNSLLGYVLSLLCMHGYIRVEDLPTSGTSFS
jgi:hypothetical protein